MAVKFTRCFLTTASQVLAPITTFDHSIVGQQHLPGDCSSSGYWHWCRHALLPLIELGFELWGPGWAAAGTGVLHYRDWDVHSRDPLSTWSPC